MGCLRAFLLVCLLAWIPGNTHGTDAGSGDDASIFETMRETGLRWLMPVSHEVMHTEALNMCIELILPPTGDFHLGIRIDAEFSDVKALECSWDCPPGRIAFQPSQNVLVRGHRPDWTSKPLALSPQSRAWQLLSVAGIALAR